MNSFYTLIKISTNPTAGDQITVGLLLKSDKIYLNFSEHRISTAFRLLKDQVKLFNFFRKQLETHVSILNNNKDTEDKILFRKEDFLTPGFMLHLSNISQNLVQFSAPSIISGIVKEEEFKKLFEIFVDKLDFENVSDGDSQSVLYSNVHTKLISRISHRVHTNININKDVIPSLNFSFNIDAIGKNGTIISAKAIDFNAGAQTIERNLVRYEVLLSKLSDIFSNVDHPYVIADEPSSKESENYNIWETLNKKKNFEVVKSSDSDKIASLFEEKNAGMFLPVS